MSASSSKRRKGEPLLKVNVVRPSRHNVSGRNTTTEGEGEIDEVDVLAPRHEVSGENTNTNNQGEVEEVGRQIEPPASPPNPRVDKGEALDANPIRLEGGTSQDEIFNDLSIPERDDPPADWCCCGEDRLGAFHRGKWAISNCKLTNCYANAHCLDDSSGNCWKCVENVRRGGEREANLMKAPLVQHPNSTSSKDRPTARELKERKEEQIKRSCPQADSSPNGMNILRDILDDDHESYSSASIGAPAQKADKDNEALRVEHLTDSVLPLNELDDFTLHKLPTFSQPDAPTWSNKAALEEAEEEVRELEERQRMRELKRKIASGKSTQTFTDPTRWGESREDKPKGALTTTPAPPQEGGKRKAETVPEVVQQVKPSESAAEGEQKLLSLRQTSLSRITSKPPAEWNLEQVAFMTSYFPALVPSWLRDSVPPQDSGERQTRTESFSPTVIGDTVFPDSCSPTPSTFR